jgi:hypothetical protein
MASLRRDGSPRISGVETEFADGEVLVGMMPGSVKLADVLRDPRMALHGPTEDPPEGAPGGWAGEAKMSGRAVEVAFPDSPVAGGRRFRLDIEEVVLTHLNPAGDRVVVESWHPGRGRHELARA